MDNKRELLEKLKLQIIRLINKMPERMEIGMEKNSKLEELLQSEEKRANLDRLLESSLLDINGGHWDIFDEKKLENEVHFLTIDNKKIYGRDPRQDVDKNSIVAIDFGTKSTVAVYRDNRDKIYPLEIGSNSDELNIRRENYENPTMIEFLNFENFKKKYIEIEGRPQTKWKDIRVSHHAKNTFVESDNPESLNAILSDIKQWASSNKKINIKDSVNDYIINKYLEENNDIDPVEIYAYYIGLNLNNMCNKKIFMKYNLSYPVTYERAVREKIRKSFEKGIKKSIPTIILKDEELMKSFFVKNFNSEPFCYAATALKQYNFFEKARKKDIFYSVFDFGGGTTDFDFGFFRNLEKGKAKYEIESLSSGGNRYLGGENILQKLAYELFMSEENIKRLKEKNYQIYLPENEERPLDNVDMINDTKEARSNLIKLSDSLRFVWEKKESPEEYSQDVGKLSITLLDKYSNQSIFDFEIDIEKLEVIIKELITEGVKAFMSELVQTINNKIEDSETDEINIFLGGNSSKSDYVKEIFEKEIQNFVADKKNKEKINIFPPLGSEEAIKKQQEMGYKVEKDTFSPNCKTGVAYGSILLRSGGLIKVKNNEEEVPFNYIVGIKEWNGKFIDILSKYDSYREWRKYIEATEIENEIYYTDNQSNLIEGNKEKNIKNMFLDNLENEYTDEDFIYIRSISPNKIEYCVSNEEAINNDEYIENPKEIDLSKE